MDFGDFLMLLLIVVNFAGTIFWVYVLLACTKQESGKEQIAWITFLLLTQWIGALYYYFKRYDKDA